MGNSSSKAPQPQDRRRRDHQLLVAGDPPQTAASAAEWPPCQREGQQAVGTGEVALP